MPRRGQFSRAVDTLASLCVHDRASHQAVITRMRETLKELGRDDAEHQALSRQPLSWSP
jgi:hypothetical protein